MRRSQRTVTSEACTTNRWLGLVELGSRLPSILTRAGAPLGATPSSTTWLRDIGGSSERGAIVFPFRRALNVTYTVALPRVWSAAPSASRSEIPSRPGLAFNDAIEDTSPLTTSDVFVTTTTLRDTATARAALTGASTPDAHATTSTVTISAATVCPDLPNRPHKSSFNTTG